MTEGKKRVQLTIEQKRLHMEDVTVAARVSEDARRAANTSKSAKLKELRVKADADRAGKA